VNSWFSKRATLRESHRTCADDFLIDPLVERASFERCRDARVV
jgi:hypothetical protein